MRVDEGGTGGRQKGRGEGSQERPAIRGGKQGQDRSPAPPAPPEPGGRGRRRPGPNTTRRSELRRAGPGRAPQERSRADRRSRPGRAGDGPERTGRRATRRALTTGAMAAPARGKKGAPPRAHARKLSRAATAHAPPPAPLAPTPPPGRAQGERRRAPCVGSAERSPERSMDSGRCAPLGPARSCLCRRAARPGRGRGPRRGRGRRLGAGPGRGGGARIPPAAATCVRPGAAPRTGRMCGYGAGASPRCWRHGAAEKQPVTRDTP